MVLINRKYDECDVHDVHDSTSQILSKIGRAQRIFVYKFSSYQLKVIQLIIMSARKERA